MSSSGDRLARAGRDPWGNPYLYTLDREGPMVMSYGRDGVAGGTGTDAVLFSRQPAEDVSVR